MKTAEVVDKLLKIESWDKLNKTQQLAVDQGLLDSTDNFVVIAPTSSGKTGIALLAGIQALDAGQKIVYLVPMKSLASQKEEDLKAISKDVAGYASSPAEWEKAKVLVTTFESFYKSILISPIYAKQFGLAIVDDFQVLYDIMRGFNLEKVVTLLKEIGIRIICLSATFEDKSEIGEWLNAQLIVIPDDARDIKIKHDVIALEETKTANQNQELCKKLIEIGKEPYLVFCTRKDYTLARAKTMCSLLNDKVTEERELRKLFSETVNRKNLTTLEEELLQCMLKGVAFHHSGLDSRLKNLVEEFYAQKKVSYLFATTGLAYGVNFPAKTVVVADTSFYDPSILSKRRPIPVYMYIQMAGRAGRSGLGNEGYAYIVKKGAESIEKYQEGIIEKAISVVGNDDYFRKTILELVYSQRCKDEEILEFFGNTFFNFQSERKKVEFIKFDLFKTLKDHVEYLYERGFITPVGASGYVLTGLGEVTVGFLFSTFADYPLAPFEELDKILEKEKKVRQDDFIIYTLSKLFGGARLSKYPREKSEEISKFLENKGIHASNQKAPEYSTYAIFYGWIENLELTEIENRYKVYASRCPEVGKELSRLLTVYENLARKKNIAVPDDFNDFKDRFRFGVTEEELPLVRLKGIGRETTRKIKAYCENALRRQPWNLKGSIIEIFEQIYKDRGEVKFVETLQFIKGIGKGKKLDKILGLVRSRVSAS
jgi:helicase